MKAPMSQMVGAERGLKEMERQFGFLIDQILFYSIEKSSEMHVRSSTAGVCMQYRQFIWVYTNQ